MAAVPSLEAQSGKSPAQASSEQASSQLHTRISYFNDGNFPDDSFPSSSMPPEVLGTVISSTQAIGLVAKIARADDGSLADAGLAFALRQRHDEELIPNLLTLRGERIKSVTLPMLPH